VPAIIATSCAIIALVGSASWAAYEAVRTPAGQTVGTGKLTSEPQTRAAVTSFPTIVPPDAENVPLYPDGRKVDKNKVYDSDWRRTRYNTVASIDDVMGFYKAQLPKQGWVLEREQAYVGGFRGWLFYEWEDSAQVLPWNLELEIYIEQLQNGELHVNQTLDRVPNLGRIPLYSDATQVQTRQVPSSWRRQYVERHIAYITNANPEDVVAYYRTVLPQCDWYEWGETEKGSSDGDNHDSDGADVAANSVGAKDVCFRWAAGSVHKLKFVDLCLATQQEPDGRTAVRIKLDGTILP